MLQRIRNSRYSKGIALALAFQLFATAINWDVVFAGDGGPTQPEVHSFEPVGTDQMVDLFTGDFTHNIPLFNLPGPDGGYPINLAYHSGIQMDQEASWVGLGWNINMGTINRQVRNLPDDFGGEDEQNITIKTDMRPNWTVGISGEKNWELFGFSLGGDGIAAIPSISAGLNIYYNNYKGLGVSKKIGLSLRIHDVKDGVLSNSSGDLGFNVKIDQQEGISSNVSAGVDYGIVGLRRNNTVATGFNNRTGWQRNLQIQNATSTVYTRNQYSASGGANLSFAGQQTQLTIPQAMRGVNASFSFGWGPSLPGLLKKNELGVNYGNSTLKDRNKTVNHKGYGYLYYQKAYDPASFSEPDRRVIDYNRENDGLVHKNTRRLGTPTLSYDVYSVTGQGIGNMFRPVRSDIGMLEGPFIESKFYGGDLGLENNVGGPKRFGIDIGFQYSGNKTAHWPLPTPVAQLFQDMDASLTRSVYYKNYGELSSDELTANYGASVSSNKPVAFGFDAEDNFYDITNIDQNTNGNAVQINTQRQSRRKRAVGVEAFTNSMITHGNNTIIPEFNIRYYQSGVSDYNTSNLSDYTTTRANHLKSRVGGYIATNESGMRYVYALPAQNKIERDVSFSVAETPGMLNNADIFVVPTSGSGVDYKQPGTNKYYNSIEKKEYAHSYLLTSILGMDYVDMDNAAGPSDGDLGYWVKFNYLKAHDNYKWRAPYSGAMYDKGYETSFTDGKGHYSYGEKEIWYVATVETKTHIAEFIVSPRNDAKQVDTEIQGDDGTGSYYKLDRIDVYTKAERYKNGTYNASAKPMQSIHFTYDYSLCKGTPDNPSPTQGKLTLKKVHFTYRNNLSGSARPYTFEYNTTVNSQEITYNRESVDRWGNYQPGALAANIDYPYNDPLTAKTTMDQRAALWNMKAINLPSGGRYEIDYESDSYAYVQNEVAMHMFKIASLEPYKDINGELISPTTAIQHSKDAADEHRKVYFQLEKPIHESVSVADRKKLMERYIKTNEYLYFKVKINLTKNNGSQEYVAGYARVKDIDVDLTSTTPATGGAGGNNYIWGAITLDFLKVDGENTHFHPFTEAGARHLRYNQPDILYENNANADMDNLSKSQIKNLGQSMYADAHDIVTIFKDFTAKMYGNGNDRLSDINLDKSYLRLRTPDKEKFGGGHRVKEIRVIDNWAASFLSGTEATSVYGTVYDYTMKDANGETISSGVAAYEPMVGGDEIPLRNPVKGWEDKNIASKTLAQTYTEEPGNESLFPGPTVGYRQVRVMSKNTAERTTNGSVNYGGISLYEFYTAKDFPVITDQTELQTDKTFRKSRLIIPAVIVNIDRLRMAASQGYYIETNDMHGKSKGAKEIIVNAQNIEEVVSEVSYEYFDSQKLTTNRAGETFVTRSLNNRVDVIRKDYNASNLTQADIQQTDLGTEIEFVPEMRYHQSRNISAGLQLNFDFSLAFPLLFPVPSFNWQEEKTGTVVTNKIVNKAGILKKVTATQRGSIIETENLAFDDLTGAPLLTSVTNDFGNKIYNYSIMAREQYEGTGPAYETIGQTTFVTAVGSVSNGLQEIALNTPSDYSKFVYGDVFLANPVELVSGEYQTDFSRSKVICHYNKRNGYNSNLVVETSTGLSGIYQFTVIRSGKRNTLTSAISSITALSDPTKNRVAVPCLDDRNVKYNQDYSLYTIDNVLSINAVELGHHWYKDSRQLGVNPSSFWYDQSSFSKGFGGVYGPVRSYAYVDNRKQTELLGVTTVNLETDGVFDDVPLFKWGRLQAVSSSAGCTTKWKEVDQITMKNPSSFTIETRNPLKVYSTSVYGSKGTEPIGVAANAKNTEVGVENFEEYASGSIDILANATNNLNFYTTIATPGTPRYAEDRFDVVTGYDNKAILYESNGAMSNYNSFTLRIHFDEYLDPNTSTFYKAEEVLVNLPTGNVAWSTPNNYYIVTLPAMGASSPIQVPKYDDRKWRGELYGRKTLPNYPASANTGVSIVNNVGHTGNNCLGITSLTGSKFTQARLALKADKEYQLSGWFSTPNNAMLQTNYSSLFLTPMKLEFLDQSGNLLSGFTKTYTEKEILQGSFIDDWRKFTVNFTMPAGAAYVVLVLPTSQEVYDNDAQEYIQIAYYDDIRIQPRDAAMTSYVYNSENQRLEAQLDDNNYATFYYYDDEGNLFLVKRETEKGIITVQESRTYLRKN